MTAAVDLRPDVVLMDVRMPLMEGIAATPAIAAQCPDVRVLVITTFDLDGYVMGALPALQQDAHRVLPGRDGINVAPAQPSSRDRDGHGASSVQLARCPSDSRLFLRG